MPHAALKGQPLVVGPAWSARSEAGYPVESAHLALQQLWQSVNL